MNSPEGHIREKPLPTKQPIMLCYRPIFDLNGGVASAFECAERGAGNFDGEYASSPQFAHILQRAVDDLIAFSVADLMISLPADAVSRGFPAKQLQSELQYALSKGGRLTILVGWPHIGSGIAPIADALAQLRRLGCHVGIDNFGFAPVPLLWPAVHHLDCVRVDARIVSLTTQSLLPPRMIASVLQMLRDTGVRNIILDGCTEDAHRELALDHGATHAQGGLFGSPRLSYSLPT